MTRNAVGQPNAMVSHGTSSGATRAPTLLPALKMPVARARSFLGNHSLTVLTAAGKLPPSASPRAKRAALKPSTVMGISQQPDRERLQGRGHPVAQLRFGRDEPGQGVGHRRQAPEQDRQGVTEPDAQAVDEPAGARVADGIGDLEGEDDVAVVDLVPAELLGQIGLENADHLAVDVVEGRGEEQQGTDAPAGPAHRRLRPVHSTLDHSPRGNLQQRRIEIPVTICCLHTHD